MARRSGVRIQRRGGTGGTPVQTPKPANIFRQEFETKNKSALPQTSQAYSPPPGRVPGFNFSHIPIFPAREAAIQLKASSRHNDDAQTSARIGPAGKNKTGFPDRLKAGLENLSGKDLSGVRVHYNSPNPRQFNARAYTQGPEIHVAPGQEKHLPHEGWHAVQQMDGRVKPMNQAKGGAINDEQHLEREADVMAGKAMQIGNPDLRSIETGTGSMRGDLSARPFPTRSANHAPIQRTIDSAADELFRTGIINVTRRLIRGKFSKTHEVSEQDLNAIQARVNELHETRQGTEEQAGAAQELYTHPDGHEGKHLRLSNFPLKKLLKMTKEGQPATFVGTWASDYNARLVAVIGAAAPNNIQFVNCGERVGVDAGEITNFVQLYYGGEIGSHMRPKAESQIKGEHVTL